jgi:D-lactate dehydrogenase (cytochrome)
MAARNIVTQTPVHRIRFHELPPVAPPAVETDPDITASFLEDAAHYPGGHAAGVVRPRSIEEVSALLHSGQPVLPVGAQSSLTGGATPMGGLVLSTEHLTALRIEGGTVSAGAGVPLNILQDFLRPRGRWFPPVPTFLGAFVGGAVATSAAGAATFKYGTVREWIDGVTVVLAGGDVIELRRGQVVASPFGTFEVETSTGSRIVRVPAIRMPGVPKRSAAYFAAPGMDLVDLFIGCEGTLGVIVEAVLRTAPVPAATCRALVPVAGEPAAIELCRELRDEARKTLAEQDRFGIDIAAIEHIDQRSIQLLREEGIDRRLDIMIPDRTGALLLIELELGMPASIDVLWHQLESARESTAIDSPLTRFCRLLDRHRVLDDAEVALPADARRQAAFVELREAVPAAVNRRVAAAQRNIDARISKTAADMIVPFERFGDMMRGCRRLFAERDLDLAVWGHISDGNVHPNVIPRSAADVDRGREAILELGEIVIAMGGCPLAEHGVGRNAIKQQLLEKLYGKDGITQMRAVKAALDPNGQLAAGVLF